MNPDPRICPGCRVELDPVAGPVHRYMESTPACWAKYGELLAREYERPEFRVAHRLTVDVYAAQHPGRPSPQAKQSVAVHLISLYAELELGVPHQKASQLLQSCADRGRFSWLTPPATRGEVSLLHPLEATTPEQYLRRMREWARSVWQAWAPAHAQIRTWAEPFLG